MTTGSDDCTGGKPLCALTHIEALARIQELEAVWRDPVKLHANLLAINYPVDLALHLAGATDYDAMAGVLENLAVQLWGPPHPDADYPRHWRDLPAKLAEELAEDESLRDRMSELLTGVAAGLNGPPPPLRGWDWSDLPAKAAALKDERDLFRHGHRVASDNCVRLEGKLVVLAADAARWSYVRQDRVECYVAVRDRLGVVDTFCGAALDAQVDALRLAGAADGVEPAP